MRKALALICAGARQELEVDGEMQADSALSIAAARARHCRIRGCEGEANVLILPNLDAGNTALQLTRVIAQAPCPSARS